MARLQVRDIDDRLYKTLKNAAKRQNRSISQEVVTMLETHLNSDQKPAVNATLEFLKLSGAWKDDRTAEKITVDIVIYSLRISDVAIENWQEGI